MATHSSVLAWRIPGTGEPGGLPSMGSHRVGHDWSDLAAAAASLTYSIAKDTKTNCPEVLQAPQLLFSLTSSITVAVGIPVPSPSPKVETPWDCSPLPGCTCHLVLKTLGFPVNIFPYLHAPSSTFFSTKGIGICISFLLPLWKMAINFLHFFKLPKIFANKIPHLMSKSIYLNIQRYIKNSYNSYQKEKN